MPGLDFSVLERHEKIALSFSGGKDSLACVQLLRSHLARITIYHTDTGDLLPEMRDSVRRVEDFAPHFVRIETNVSAWIDQHGLPTDLLPHSSHPLGEVMGEANIALVPRYECCWHNLMFPTFERIVQDNNTLLIRGTKAIDMRRLPVKSGDLIFERLELWLPLQDWTNEQVFAYLAIEKVPVPRVYNYVVNSPECARCSAWWGENRANYLKRYHPLLWQEYDNRLQLVINEIAGPLKNLRREAGVD